MTLSLAVVLNLINHLIPSQPDLTFTVWSVGLSQEVTADIWSISLRIDTNLPLPVVIPRIYTTIQETVASVPYPGLVLQQPRVVHIIGSSNPGSTWGRGQNHFTFRLRTIQVQGSLIWNNLSDLEIENPIVLSDSLLLVRTVNQALLTHPLFGFTTTSPLLIRTVEIVLSTDPACIRVSAIRPGDPDCELPLPRHLEDYDITREIQNIDSRKVKLVYHVSEVDLASHWNFEFCVRHH